MDKISLIGHTVQLLLNEMYAIGKEDGIAEEERKVSKSKEDEYENGYDAGYDEGYKTAMGEAYTPNL